MVKHRTRRERYLAHICKRASISEFGARGLSLAPLVMDVSMLLKEQAYHEYSKHIVLFSLEMNENRQI